MIVFIATEIDVIASSFTLFLAGKKMLLKNLCLNCSHIHSSRQILRLENG
jgi:hypothetical protein